MAQKVEDASLWPLPEYFDRLKIFTYFDPRMFAKLPYAKLLNLVFKNFDLKIFFSYLRMMMLSSFQRQKSLIHLMTGKWIGVPSHLLNKTFYRRQLLNFLGKKFLKTLKRGLSIQVTQLPSRRINEACVNFKGAIQIQQSFLHQKITAIQCKCHKRR